MWYVTENGTDTCPVALDKVSSKKWVYIRKDFTYIEETEGNPAHYSYMEKKVPKDDWAIYEEVINHGEALDDVYNALAELAEMITEE